MKRKIDSYPQIEYQITELKTLQVPITSADEVPEPNDYWTYLIRLKKKSKPEEKQLSDYGAKVEKPKELKTESNNQKYKNNRVRRLKK